MNFVHFHIFCTLTEAQMKQKIVGHHYSTDTQIVVNLLGLTLSAVTTGISLGLLKRTEAAQKGAKKKGTFLQKPGRMLDPYLPA